MKEEIKKEEKKEVLSVDEWNTLFFALIWVFNAVAGADGIIDKKEQEAMKRICSKAKKVNLNLAEKIFTALDENLNTIYRQCTRDQRGYQKGLDQVCDLLRMKFSREISLKFRKMLLAGGFYIANVSSDHMGNKISKEEIQVIQELMKLLNLSKDEIASEPSVSDYMAIYASNE